MIRPTIRQLSTLSIRSYSTTPLPKSFTSTLSTSTPTPTPSPSTTSEPKAPSHPSPFYRPEPPLVAAARKKSVKQRNVWESYLVLSPTVRLYFCLGLMVFAGIGLWAGDKLVPLTEEEKEVQRLSK